MLHLVTTLTDSYSPGFAALLQSMRENAGVPYRFTVVTYDAISNPHRSLLSDLCPNIEWIDVRDLGEFPAPRTATPRMAVNFQKCLLWRLPYQHNLIYIDTDILCLGDLSELETAPHLSVVRGQHTIGKNADHHYQGYMHSGLWTWNAGLYVFRPSEAIYDGLVRQSTLYRRPVVFGDQVVQVDYFNCFRPTDVNYLDWQWNMSIWAAALHPGLFASTPVKILHYAEPAKPWLHWRRFEWQQPFWDLWHRYYTSIPGAPPLWRSACPHTA